VLISCGFDLKKNDTHGTLQVTAAGISGLTKTVMDIADTHADGKLVALLEGGYADSDGNNTYHGLAECADSLTATLVSGELQNESPYFAGQAIKNNQSRSGRQAPRIVGNFITIPVNAHCLIAYNGLGKTVRDIRLHPSGGNHFDMRTMHLEPGLYNIRILDNAGNTLSLWSCVRHSSSQ
jgi:hypothetical protein